MTTTHPSPPVEGPYATYNIDLMSGSNCEVQDLTSRFVDRATVYGMEVTTKKTKIMTNSTNIISADISINGQS